MDRHEPGRSGNLHLQNGSRTINRGIGLLKAKIAATSYARVVAEV